ncbi:hypothetical protein EDD21DRAFT_392097 [Dissophora ornata]|nr:hypothetical protein EDD21DRAFT_392097 [Dissophora ornata]
MLLLLLLLLELHMGLHILLLWCRVDWALWLWDVLLLNGAGLMVLEMKRLLLLWTVHGLRLRLWRVHHAWTGRRGARRLAVVGYWPCRHRAVAMCLDGMWDEGDVRM